jgi:general secretion pathway protein I
MNVGERRGRERGFTLLEVMVAVAVLAIALPILLGLRNHDVALREEAKAVTNATLLAQEKLFETEILGFPPVGETRGDFATLPPGSLTSAEVKDRAPGFRWTRLVVPTPFEQIREVRIRVSWPGGASERVVEITNYVFLEPQRTS